MQLFSAYECERLAEEFSRTIENPAVKGREYFDYRVRMRQDSRTERWVRKTFGSAIKHFGSDIPDRWHIFRFYLTREAFEREPLIRARLNPYLFRLGL